MKWMLMLILLLAGSMGIGWLALEDAGYVVIARSPFEIQLSFSTFLVVQLLFFVALYISLRMLGKIRRAPEQAIRGLHEYQSKRAQLDLFLGYADLLEGSWNSAETRLQKKISHSRYPLLGHLGSAYAAQQRGDSKQRDAYLDKAREENPKSDFAIGIAQARMQYRAGELAAAILQLKSLHQRKRTQPMVIRMLAECYRQTGQWQELSQLLKQSYYCKPFTESELADIESTTIGKLISAQNDQKNQSEIVWNALSRRQKKNPEIVAQYVEQLLARNEHIIAEKHLRKTLNQSWHAKLIGLYGQTNGDIQRQLKQTMQWSEKHPEDAELLLCRARLFRRQKQNKIAQSLLQTAVDSYSHQPSLLELADLLEEQGDYKAALDCLHQSKGSASNKFMLADTPPPVMLESKRG